VAAPSWEAKGTYFEDSGITSANFAVPAGVTANKVVVVSAFINGSIAINSLPTGFQHAEGSPISVIGAGAHSLAVCWKRATGNDSGTYNFGLDGSTFVAGIAELFNTCVLTGTPLDSPTDSASSSTDSSVTPPVDIDTKGPDRLVLHRGTIWSGGSWTPPVGFSERVDQGFGHIICSDKEFPSTINTGSITATSTGNDKRAAWIGALIGTTVGGTLASISDEARSNMLAELGISEPQNKSNTDLMRDYYYRDGC
jgi:hypothetical protein